ncbi:hypothetical protein PHYBOEH_001098 [Phytophthora boehmeriae]|uniref:Uncharacterized protein n=1 Tax=Phytophthora boehmeriae TaxID=109152 RepID=A0A8T1X0E0_9STRA|nr:hypothetical protein PHYBOEH_001098 [Phytophthora boehmeriae]
MNFLAGIAVVGVMLSAVDADSIGHDKVQPFAQPESVTFSEKAAVQFKPSLVVYSGCHPYPAVNAAGETSGGLKPSGSSSGQCEKPELGSQIYGRAGWYSNMWAIMYAWYFPKDDPPMSSGHRHDWENIVVWIDNPEANPPMLKAVSAWINEESRYDQHHASARAYNNARKYSNGSSPNIRYRSLSWFRYTRVDMSVQDDDAEFQDLIMWEQLTNEARSALESTDFGDAKVPFNDANYQSLLDKAWPY